MADFDKINIDSASYNVKDTQAREDLAAETTAREQADTQLGQEISAETTAREQADTQLGQQIEAEQQARQQADTQLGQQFSALAGQTLSGAKIITPQMYGAVGNGVTDDTDAFIAAIQDAYDNGYTLYIPATGNLDVPAGYNGYVLSKTLNITKPMTILADPLSVLNWKNMTTEPTQSGTDPTTGAILYSSGVGINIDYGNYSNHKGTYRFGIIQGCKNYTYPGASAPSGHYGTAVRIANGDLVNFYAKYISYWDTGLHIQANVNFTANETISFDVMDDCQTGVHFNTTGPNYIEGVNLTFNTIGLCRYGIIFTANNSTAGIHGINIRGAEIWTEYTNGSCLYTMTDANILYNSNINVQELYNICNPSTSKEGIGTAYYGPFISGTGNQCFKATNTTIKCGCSVSNDAQYAEKAGIGLDGSISFTNLIEQFANNYSTAYTPMSTKSGVFNSGVIPLANYMYVHFTLSSTLSAGSTTSFYVQMQNAISGGSMRPYIMPLNGYPVVMSITDVSDYTDYQVYKIDLLAVTDQSNGTDFYAIVGNGN